MWLEGTIASGAVATALTHAGTDWVGLVDARRPARARAAAEALARRLGADCATTDAGGGVTTLTGWSSAGQAAIAAGTTWLVLPVTHDAEPGPPLPLRLHAAETALLAHGLDGLWAPLLGWEPVAIARLALGVGTPFELTWDCERDAACGICAGCVGRIRAFKQLGMPDPVA
ncbi:MAG: 7-cyano-7-deazaguanine synthase [Candidatus Sericytochromatia bacterium]